MSRPDAGGAYRGEGTALAGAASSRAVRIERLRVPMNTRQKVALFTQILSKLRRRHAREGRRCTRAIAAQVDDLLPLVLVARCDSYYAGTNVTVGPIHGIPTLRIIVAVLFFVEGVLAYQSSLNSAANDAIGLRNRLTDATV